MEEKQDVFEVAEIIEKEDFDQFAKSERTKATVTAAAVVIANLLMYICGTSIDAGIIADAIMGIVVLAATCYGVWKNHNFTKAAAAGQLVVDTLKSEEKAAKHAATGKE